MNHIRYTFSIYTPPLFSDIYKLLLEVYLRKVYTSLSIDNNSSDKMSENIISVWNFPEDKFFILKDNFRYQFFSRLTEKIGGQRELARRLNIHYMRLRKIILGKRFRNKSKRNENVGY